MKKTIALLLVLVLGMALLASCDSGPALRGKFVNPDDSEEWIEFKSGGKITTSSGGIKFDGKFTVDGDKVTATMKFLGMESVEEYILSENETKLTDQSWMKTVYIKK